MKNFPFCFTRALLLLGLGSSVILAAEKNASAEPDSPARTTAQPATKGDEEPAPSGTKAEQLAIEQKKLNVMRLRYDEKHPAFVKQRAKVIRLQQEAKADEPKAAPGDRGAQLEVAKRDLEGMLERYTEQHPSVIAQRRKIAELEAAK